MKKLFKNFLMLTAVGAIAFLYSCGEDEEPVPVDAPTVTISADSEDAYDVGSTANVSINYTAAGGLGGIQYTVAIGSEAASSPVSLDISNDAGNTSGSGSFTLDITEAMGGNTVTISVTVADQSTPTELSGSDDITITVNEASPDATVVTAKMLAAPTGDNTSMTFYSIRLNQLYSQADVIGTADPVSENIDLGYYYGGTNNATLVSPDEYPTNIVDITSWGTRHTTNLVLTTISSETYMGITSVADVTGAVADVTFGDSNEVTNLAVGDILAFETTDETAISGLIMVQEVNGTNGSDGNIVIELITSQEAQ